jgi:hypothetical protein
MSSFYFSRLFPSWFLPPSKPPNPIPSVDNVVDELTETARAKRQKVSSSFDEVDAAPNLTLSVDNVMDEQINTPRHSVEPNPKRTKQTKTKTARAKRQEVSLTMTNPSSLTLLCQAVDEDKSFLGAIFPLNVPLFSLLVGELKKQVFGEKKSLLGARGIDADELVLWKVSTLISTGRTRAEKTQFRQNIQAIEFPDVESDKALNGNGVVQLLDPPERLEAYWTEDPEGKRLHLVVGVPRSYRSVDDEKETKGSTSKLLSFIPYYNSKH